MAKKKKQQEVENLQEQFREYRDDDIRILKKKSIKDLLDEAFLSQVTKKRS